MLAVLACSAAVLILGGGSLAAWRIARKAGHTIPPAPEGGWLEWDDEEDWAD
jgi:hypothetical protein